MSKGINAERDLVEWAWGEGYAALRAPGSGSIDRPSPDVVIFTEDIIAIELKAASDGTATFDGDEVIDLGDWAKRCGADAYVGVKPDLRSHDQWYFVHVDQVHMTPSMNFSIRKEDHDDCLSREDLL